MGLLDVFRGMLNGPRGQPAPRSQSGGMSPLTMGLIALLAYKALKSFGSRPASAGNALPGEPMPANYPSGTRGTGYPADPRGAGYQADPRAAGGDWTDWLRGSFGSALAGGAAGSVLSGGLAELLRRFQQNGQGDVARSWISRGPNESISPSDLERAAGADDLDALAREAGMPRDQLLRQLSDDLPRTVDHLTPEGRLPTPEEASHWV